MNKVELIRSHQARLGACRLCPDMVPPVILGEPVCSEILLVGQAPGDREGELGRPFAWTAGKTLFKWFDSIGVREREFQGAGLYVSGVSMFSREKSERR